MLFSETRFGLERHVLVRCCSWGCGKFTLPQCLLFCESVSRSLLDGCPVDHSSWQHFFTAYCKPSLEQRAGELKKAWSSLQELTDQPERGSSSQNGQASRWISPAGYCFRLWEQVMLSGGHILSDFKYKQDCYRQNWGESVTEWLWGRIC